MAARRGSKRGGEQPGIVRRPPAERKRLAPEFEALARGEQDVLRRPPRGPRLRDPRTVGLVPGVANRDARMVYDARLEEMERALRGHPDDAEASRRLCELLVEAVRLGLWRGRSVTGLDAFAEQVLGLDAAEARQLAERGAEATGMPCRRASDEAVAAWMRAEAALRQAGLDGRVRCDVDEMGNDRLHVELEAARAPEALDRIARYMGPLVQDRRPHRGRGRRE